MKNSVWREKGKVGALRRSRPAGSGFATGRRSSIEGLELREIREENRTGPANWRFAFPRCVLV